MREKGFPEPSRLGAKVVLPPPSPPRADLVGPTDPPPWDGRAVAGVPFASGRETLGGLSDVVLPPASPPGANWDGPTDPPPWGAHAVIGAPFAGGGKALGGYPSANGPPPRCRPNPDCRPPPRAAPCKIYLLAARGPELPVGPPGNPYHTLHGAAHRPLPALPGGAPPRQRRQGRRAGLGTGAPADVLPAPPAR